MHKIILHYVKANAMKNMVHLQMIQQTAAYRFVLSNSTCMLNLSIEFALISVCYLLTNWLIFLQENVSHNVQLFLHYLV